MAHYDYDDRPFTIDAEGSLPTAEEVKNLQNFIEDEKNRENGKAVCSIRKKHIFAALLAGLLIVVGSMSVAISQNGDGNSREREVVNFLSDNFADRTALEERDSPQKRAAKWIADQDEMKLPVPASSEYEVAYKFVQRYALAVLFFAWSGEDKWSFKYQFLSASDECDWNYKLSTTGEYQKEFDLGVKCNDDHEIDYIFMPGNGLDGTIPGELGLLLALSHLSLFNNNLVGQLPVQMMYLTDLKFLALEQNALSGKIPEWVGELTNMKFMALGGNKLDGTIPSAIVALTNLSELSLEDNILGGDINVLSQIPSVTRLFLGNNKFEGSINDSFLAGLQNLRELDLSSNQFTGTLPMHFFNLDILDLHDNDLKGEIPKPVHAEYPLKYLLLHNNGFSGVLHNSIAYFKSLKRLDVSNNELTGPLPESIADMKGLQYLYLANNEWAEGQIPEWRNLTSLLELSLKGTNRVDEIPEWMGREMRSLQLLSLDDNLLSGEIPETLGHLKDLRYLLLNQNNLTGTIPETLKHLQQLKMIRIDENGIDGSTDPICFNVPPDLEIFTSDCKSTNLKCECCSNCCDSPNSNCNDVKLPEEDISWKHGYPKNQALFSEDLVFQDLGN